MTSVCSVDPCGFFIKSNKLTVNNNLAVCSIVIDLLDVAKVDVTEEDAIDPLSSPTMIVKAESNDVFHVVRVLKWFYGGI